MRRRRGEVVVVPEDGWDETPLSDAGAPAWQDDLFAAAPSVDELLARRGEEPAFIDRPSWASISSAEPLADVLEEPPVDPLDDLALADDPFALAQAPTGLEPESAAAEREPEADLQAAAVEPASLGAVDPLDEQVGAEQPEPESVVLSAAPGLDPVVAAEAPQVHEPEPAPVELLVLPPAHQDDPGCAAHGGLRAAASRANSSMTNLLIRKKLNDHLGLVATRDGTQHACSPFTPVTAADAKRRNIPRGARICKHLPCGWPFLSNRPNSMSVDFIPLIFTLRRIGTREANRPG